MMRLGAELGYAEVDGVQALSLPYSQGELGMVVLLPAEGRFGEFESALDAGTIDSVFAALERTRVTLQMPKFTFESSFALKDALAAMGMPLAFDPGNADLSGMDGARDLFISSVLHKAFVSVDEKGTEAAAATAGIAGITSAPSRQVDLALDRPFVFVIRDITGTVLFVGRVVDPRS